MRDEMQIPCKLSLMKNIIFFILFLTHNAIAQPGDIRRARAERLDNISKLLQKNPHDVSLIWERINLIFDPYLVMVAAPLEYQYDPNPLKNDSLLSYGDRIDLPNKKIDILKEINKLIEGNAFIIELGGRRNGIYDTLSISPSNLFLKRGQYYYLRGLNQNAIADFLKALSYNPPEYLKESICISLTAYYYHLKEGNKNENLEKALQYIDMITPVIYETQPRVLTYYSNTHDKYEREKIMLLRQTNNKARLINYLKNLSLSYLKLYIKGTSESAEYKKEHSSSIASALKTGLDYITMLTEYDIQMYTEKEIKQSVEDIILNFERK